MEDCTDQCSYLQLRREFFHILVQQTGRWIPRFVLMCVFKSDIRNRLGSLSRPIPRLFRYRYRFSFFLFPLLNLSANSVVHKLLNMSWKTSSFHCNISYKYKQCTLPRKRSWSLLCQEKSRFMASDGCQNCEFFFFEAENSSFIFAWITCIQTETKGNNKIGYL